MEAGSRVQITLSIIIPTHNRISDILENVSCLLPQCVGKPVEVILVDSASDPAEASRLQAGIAGGDVQLVRLDQPGLSTARNAGVARARGQWLGFLDDDVLPDPDWVDAALARIRVSGKLDGLIAGRVLPKWPGVTAKPMIDPDALGPRARGLLSIIDDSRIYCSSDAPVAIGANLVIRKTALDTVGGFPVHMGRVGTSLASGEEAYVVDRIVGTGFESWYDGTLCVQHKIFKHQLTWVWLGRRARQEGLVSLRKCRTSRQRFRVATKCIVGLPALAALTVFAKPRSDYVVRLHHNLGFAQGAAAALLQRRRVDLPRNP
jgi:glycosyltransferase involved in cell wall biosynthesis